MTYKDKTFCNYSSCKNFNNCNRALTNKVRALAEEWMTNAPIAVFSNKPECFEEELNEAITD